VNAELSRLEQQIESHKARIQFLQESAAFSRITVSLTADADAQPIEIGGWRPTGTARNAVQFLVNFLQVVVDTAIWLVIVGLPALLILAALLWLWRKGRAVGLIPTLRSRRPTERATPRKILSRREAEATNSQEE
jgi:LPXTG-motif cell wall-anchored protein